MKLDLDLRYDQFISEPRTQSTLTFVVIFPKQLSISLSVLFSVSVGVNRSYRLMVWCVYTGADTDSASVKTRLEWTTQCLTNDVVTVRERNPCPSTLFPVHHRIGTPPPPPLCEQNGRHDWQSFLAQRTLGSTYNKEKDAKETARWRWVFVVTELFSIGVNYYSAKKSARYSWVLVVTELVISGIAIGKNRLLWSHLSFLWAESVKFLTIQ